MNCEKHPKCQGPCGQCAPERRPIPAGSKYGARDLLDDDGENRAVRAFLMLYSPVCGPGLTAVQMRDHMKAMGYPYWPDWVDRSPGHLTKGGAQLWLRMLFELEHTAQPVTTKAATIDLAGHQYDPTDLLRRAVRKIKPGRAGVAGIFWSVVRDNFAVGSSVAMALCSWAGLDPDTGKDKGRSA